MSEAQLGEGFSCCSLMPGPLPALRYSFPQPFTPCLGIKMVASSRSCVLASAGSCRAPSALSPTVLGITEYSSTPATYSSASPAKSQGKRVLVSPCHPPCHGASGEMLAAAGRQERDGRAEGVIFQFHLSWALA